MAVLALHFTHEPHKIYLLPVRFGNGSCFADRMHQPYP